MTYFLDSPYSPSSYRENAVKVIRHKSRYQYKVTDSEFGKFVTARNFRTAKFQKSRSYELELLGSSCEQCKCGEIIEYMVSKKQIVSLRLYNIGNPVETRHACLRYVTSVKIKNDTLVLITDEYKENGIDIFSRTERSFEFYKEYLFFQSRIGDFIGSVKTIFIYKDDDHVGTIISTDSLVIFKK